MTINGWAVLLGAVVVDSSNKTIRVVEGGVTTDVTLTEGTFYVLADGSGSDLLENFRAALQSATGGNTYTIAIVFDPNDANKTATITVTRATGANAVDIQWAASQTTFDESLLGFPSSTVSLSGSTIVSTLSPRCLWVADEVYQQFEPRQKRSAFVNRAKSGKVSAGVRSDTYDERVLSFQMLGEQRVNESAISSDPNRALSRFIDYVGDGKQLRLFLADMSAGTVAAPGTEKTGKPGFGWHLAEETVADFAPRRMEEGVALYDVDLRLLAHA